MANERRRKRRVRQGEDDAMNRRTVLDAALLVSLYKNGFTIIERQQIACLPFLYRQTE
jgi:hypothetical protein